MTAHASYARQADDDSLLKTVTRIKARAIRRCGELLREIEPAKGGARGNAATGPRRPVAATRTSAAEDARLSERQRKTARRVANLPPLAFEALIDTDPTRTA